MATVLSLDPTPADTQAGQRPNASLLLIRSSRADTDALLRDAVAAQGLKLVASDLAGGADHNVVIAAEIVGSAAEIGTLATALRRLPGIVGVSVAEVGAARALRHNAAREDQS